MVQTAVQTLSPGQTSTYPWASFRSCALLPHSGATFAWRLHGAASRQDINRLESVRFHARAAVTCYGVNSIAASTPLRTSMATAVRAPLFSSPHATTRSCLCCLPPHHKCSPPPLPINKLLSMGRQSNEGHPGGGDARLKHGM